MNGNDRPVPSRRRKLWVRMLLMVLLAAAFQLAVSVLLFIAVVQLVLAAATDAPNLRLQQFGRSLARYLAQVADFESFGSDKLPFPFSAWPPVDSQADL
jgi:hypothetical protein